MEPVGTTDPSVPPGPLTHLSLLDSSEAPLQSDGPSLLGSWTRASAAPPSPALLELQERAAGRNSATAGVGRRHSRQPECSGILHETLPRGEPQEAERSWPPPGWPGWASEDAPGSCPPLSLPGVMKGRDLVLLRGSPPEHAAILREGVRTCLQQRCEQTVWILHAKVAQKSYGNEKRFFCPPPCVYLAGPGWRVKPVQDQAHQSAETGPTVYGYMGLDGASGSAPETQKLNFEEQPDSREFGCAKTLYISDADKRKHFRLVLRLVLRGGQELGTFHSRLIKVISKPSQKKQSLKNTDLCISSGSKVSLFNRLRSQTVSTRYLSVEDGAFVASARQWAAFTLHLADKHCSQGDFPPQEGYIRYGSLVQLVCTVTGITLPPMIIRKVAKQCALLDVDEPISQLHKCAFQFPGDTPGGGGTYLCLATEKVVQFQASLCPKEANRALLNDSSCWTIIGTESVEFSFSTSLACTREPVTPVPLISTLELSGGGDVATLELHGENFHAGLKVWFGDVEAETMYRSPRSLVCVVPDVAAFGSDWRWLRTPITVPVSLLRTDALFYPSAFSFTYTPEYSARPRPPDAHEPAPDADALLESIHHEFTRTNFHLFCPS
ncbi:recombination signal binding protein for immunoglobulin kappa J region-like [Cricetulus griseus]